MTTENTYGTAPAATSAQGAPSAARPAMPAHVPEKQPEIEYTASVASIFESLLKHPYGLIRTIQSGEGPPALAGKLVLLSVLGFVVFGLTVGSFSLGDQIWAAPLKMLVGICFSAAICLPSLYIFAALTGTTLTLSQICQGLAAVLALCGALLLGFTPVLWVFSQSTESEAFFGGLVALAWVVSVLFGVGILFKMVKLAKPANTAPLRIWVAMFLLVTLQMSTTLRPLVGSSDRLIHLEKKFFLDHWVPDEPFNRDSGL
jgi:hypothetical protein